MSDRERKRIMILLDQKEPFIIPKNLLGADESKTPKKFQENQLKRREKEGHRIRRFLPLTEAVIQKGEFVEEVQRRVGDRPSELGRKSLMEIKKRGG